MAREVISLGIGAPGNVEHFVLVGLNADEAAAAAARRGLYARGRARLRGRRLWWLVLILGRTWNL